MENHGDTMELKVNELLKEVKLDYSASFTKLVDETVSDIERAIDTVPTDFQVTASLAPGFVRDVGADKVEFKFKKPVSVAIGGSYSIQSVAKPDVHVDLLVRMPKECFHEKDYLNHRYHAKRCLYLCVIKKYLKSSSFDKVEWSSFQNEARKPILVVYRAAKSAEVPGFCVRIIPTATSLFNVSKLNLSRNNVRAVNKEGGDPQPTPKYNCSILEDMFIEDNSDFLKKTFSGWKELGDALILLKVWARQRSSLYVQDCLNGYLISIILSYLASENQINKPMKAMQIIRTTLAFIGGNLGITVVHIWKKLHFDIIFPKKERKTYKLAFPVVICDPSTHFNLAFRMSTVGFSELLDEASSTLKCLHGDGAVEQTFMTKIDYAAKYDYYVRLNLKSNSKVYAPGFCLDDECWRLYEQKVYGVLNQALGDRVNLIRVIWRNINSESSIKNGLSTLSREPMLVGISVNSVENAFRGVDIGPDADNKEEALVFRKFWGEKAELRRFKDGRIAESTVWQCEPSKRHLILKNIIEHVLLRHLSLSKENIVQIVDQLDFSLLYGSTDPISFSGNILQAFDELSKRLRQIEDIPLKIFSVQPLDSALRSTSVFPPQPHPLANESGKAPRLNPLVPSCIQPMEVMIQLEGSGNWPTDDLAIEKTKAAFLLKIGER
ncbi:hypothetical protein ACFE04_023113 [Oxalis oulophora]